MCGGSSNNTKGKGATSSFGGYTFGHGVPSIADQRRAENKSALEKGSNISNGPGSSLGGQSGPKSASLGTANEPVATPQPKPQGVLMPHRPRLTGVFGSKGVEAIKETEEAFEGKGIMSLEPGSRGDIEVPDDFGWDFKTGKPTGGKPTWTPNRSLPGKARDMIAEAIGSPYDRSVTPGRANDMLARGKGVLSEWAEGLQEGNYQYDKRGKPDKDRIGLAYDVLKPMTDIFTGRPLNGVMSTLTAADTLMGYSKLTDAGVFGLVERHLGTPLSRKQTISTHSGEHFERDNSSRPFTVAQRRETEQEKVKASKFKETRPRSGKATLMRTGPKGLEDRAPILMQRLHGKSKKQKRPGVLMQKHYT